MGAEASQPGQPEGAAGPTHDDRMYEKLFAGEFDAKKVFEEAYADDATSLDELKRIVAELEGQKASPKEVTAERQKLERMVDEMEKKEMKLRKKQETSATAKADDWLQEQLKQSKADIAAEKEAKKQAEERRKRAEEERVWKEKAKATFAAARAEAEARARLFAGAAASIRKREVEQAAVLKKVPLPLPLPSPPEVDELPAKPVMAAGKEDCEVPEFYKLLGIGVEATFDEIKKAYRKQALRWHPDKNRHRLEQATDHFQRISEAFDTLYDAERRSMYDAGKNKDPKKMKKLAGAGWSNLSDEADAALTAQGVKWKSQSWRAHVLMNGRMDDDPEYVRQMINTMDDPRLPMEKVKIFWRFLGEMAAIDHESSVHSDWMFHFIAKVWKDTPSRWPKAQELKNMNDAGQQEWKERRLVYNRRRHKLQIHIELHEEYMAISDREDKERERLRRDKPGMANRWAGGMMSTDPMRAM